MIKVLYFLGTSAELSLNNHFEVLDLEDDEWKAVVDALQSSTMLYPPSARIMNKMNVGFLARYIRRRLPLSDSFVPMLILIVLRLSRIM